MSLVTSLVSSFFKHDNEIQRNFPTLENGEAKVAVGVFHAYAHSMACQVNYNPRFLKGFGLTDGEGLERLWSYLGEFVPITK